MTIPTGFVKSTIHASGSARAATCSASSSITGTVRIALAKPPAPVVAETSLLPADADLHEHEGRAVEDGVEIGRAQDLACEPLALEHAARERADDLEPLGVDVV